MRASRLNDAIAPFAIRRLLVRASVSPNELTAQDLARALPTIEEGLRAYLDAKELDDALRMIRALAARG